MLIHVTQEHIARGQRGSCARCPVARALRDAGLDAPLVYERGISVRVNSVRRWFLVSEAVWSAIEGFDDEGAMTPFAFEVPDEVVGR